MSLNDSFDQDIFFDETKFSELFGFEPIYIGQDVPEPMTGREQAQQPTEATPTYSDITTIKMTSGHSRIMPMKKLSPEEEELRKEEEELEHFLKMADLLDALESQTTTSTPNIPDTSTQTAYTVPKKSSPKTLGPDPELLAYTSKMFGLNQNPDKGQSSMHQI